MNQRGRLAPTPTGFLHVGHAYTFGIAAKRAAGKLILRIEDLDATRCNSEFTTAAIEDLRWLGLSWAEGPDCGGDRGPYYQSQRSDFYLQAWQRLAQQKYIYPSPQSRRDLETAAFAPHVSDEGESVFPIGYRPNEWVVPEHPGCVPWRFRVPDGKTIQFVDKSFGLVKRIAGKDFGDFVVWRRDNLAAYELAVVVDDHHMEIGEVVRGKDLLTSTARQLLLYEALGWNSPDFFHTNLVLACDGERLAKRSHGMTIRELRRQGVAPEKVRNCSVEGLRIGRHDSPRPNK
ncbi:glutamate--tRNA ligase family protein [Pirellulales bacterium]|nr:glutamate--tRNA ligase family protein [Pirellulales bacterium]